MYPTYKITHETSDGVIEAVVVSRPEKTILCVPSQLGCPLQCKFCRAHKFVRNLSHKEIQFFIDQVRFSEEKPKLLSFMGVGEPSLNLNVVLDIIKKNVIFDKFALATTGINNRIFNIDPKIKIQLSLNAPTEKIRKDLMPNAPPLSRILWDSRHVENIDLNYVLIRDLNDKSSHAVLLADLLDNYERTKVKINRYNETGQFLPSNRTDEFLETLREHGITPEYYETDGRNINAACGQMV